MNDKPKVLIISSANPLNGPGRLGLDAWLAFKDAGYSCDLLTKYKVPQYPDILYIKKEKFASNALIKKVIKKIVDCIKIIQGKYCKLYYPYCFFYKTEQSPPEDSQKILKKLTHKYELVLIYFWQEMLSFQSIEAIYDKLMCQIHFMAVDYSHMSGGCHFTGDCERYQTGCGYCKAISSVIPNDFTANNVMYRKQIYEKVRPVVHGNTYMHQFYRKSYLLKNYDRIGISFPIINSNIFYHMDEKPLRQKYKIPESKKFVIFFGSQNVSDPRKGMTYLLNALDILYGQLDNNERSIIHLLIAGKSIDSIKKRLKFSYTYVNFVPNSQLPELYSIANVFISPSINDAGPMMVNQSIMCGTPVIGFEMGALLDVIKNKGTGFCADFKDSKDLALCIDKVFRLKIQTPSAYCEMRNKCRLLALETSSPKVFVDTIIEYYYKYK